MQERYCNWFVTTTAAVLLATGVAKAWGSFAHAKVMALPNPLLGSSLGSLTLLVSVAELVVAVVCFCARVDPGLKISLVAWLATNFLVYRFGLWAGSWHHPCGCMGILGCLLVGSHANLVWEWRGGRVAKLAFLAGAAPD